MFTRNNYALQSFFHTHKPTFRIIAYLFACVYSWRSGFLFFFCPSFFRHISESANGERDDASDADAGSAAEHDEVSNPIKPADHEAHEHEGVEIAFCDPREATGDQVEGTADDASMFLCFIGFVLLFESPFKVVMAGNAEFEELAIEPANDDRHE